MRRAAKTDTNHAEIVEALREIGANVFDTHDVGSGFPDIIIGYRGVNFLAEIKGPKGTMTPLERWFHNDWGGQVAIVRTVDDAYRLIGATDDASVVGGRR